jgi:phosphoketolase
LKTQWADGNCLLSLMDHCLSTPIDGRRRQSLQGIGIWQWASNDQALHPTW